MEDYNIVEKNSLPLDQIALDFSDAESILQAVQSQQQGIPETKEVLAEIEEALKQHPAIQQAFAHVWESEAGKKNLVIYIVTDQQHSPIIAGLPRYALPNNMAVVQQNKYETDNMYKEIFEDQVYFKEQIVLEGGDCVFDIGANIGLFTLFVLQKCSDVMVYAFEPSPPVFELLRLNTQLYGGNVKLYNCGVSNERKEVPFTFYPRASTYSGYYTDHDRDAQNIKNLLLYRNKQLTDNYQHAALLNGQIDKLVEESMKKEVINSTLVPLSTIIEENSIERIDLLKIDAEKSELDILEGLRTEDWKKIRQIVMEVHDKEGKTLHKIMTILQDRDYRVVVDQQPERKATGAYTIYALEKKELDQSFVENTREPVSQGKFLLNVPLLSTGELRSFLREQLPHYALLPRFIYLDTLPLTPEGQVDLEHLSAIRQVDPELDTEFVAPRTPIEKKLVAISQEVLNLERVGIYNNFFDLGGHSLLATQVLARIHEEFEIELSLDVLFTIDFTAAELALVIEQQQIKQADPENIASILQELNVLSDEEIRSMLASEEGFGNL